jgi:ABC-type transport system involved in multi-copper enzyme maturation permease subunit
MSLFLKECRKILKSFIYYIFIGVTLLFYSSQMGMTDLEVATQYSSPPEKVDINQYFSENHRYPYGLKNGGLSIEAVPSITSKLYFEYKENKYVTYPFGFAKSIKLNDNKAKVIESALTEITGQNIESLNNIHRENFRSPNFSISSSLTMSRFNEIMEEVDNLLGGGSAYSKKFLSQLTRVPVTYEEATQNYEYLLNEDKLTNGYARLFSDYIGIVIGIFPIFAAVSMILKDKRSKMNELIYSRNTSSIKIVLSRYFSLVVMMIVPVFLISFEPLIAFIKLSLIENISIDAFAFIKYILWWILPTLMLVTAIGVFLTTLTDSTIAIAVQLFIWFLSVNTISLTGDYPRFGLLIRHNDSQMGELIRDNAKLITTNRIVVTIIALLLVIITAYIYEQKRRGKLDFNTEFRKLFKFNSSKSKA